MDLWSKVYKLLTVDFEALYTPCVKIVTCQEVGARASIL